MIAKALGIAHAFGLSALLGAPFIYAAMNCAVR